MLIVNDDQLGLAGILSPEARCTYCSKPLAAYPLIMSDDANQTAYHVTCALELATDIMVDFTRLLTTKTVFTTIELLSFWSCT